MKSSNLEILRKENFHLKKSIENIQKELHNNTKQTYDLIHRLTVKVEELDMQINSNAKSIKVRKRYAV